MFLKTDGIHKRLSHEIKAHQYFYSQYPERVPKIACFNLNGKYSFSLFEWVEGESLFDWMQGRRPLDGILAQFIELSDELYSAHVLHRDISPFNIIVSAKGSGPIKLVLFDFAFSVLCESPCDENIPKEELLALGSGYKPAPLKWDDAYSFLVMLSDMGYECFDPIMYNEIVVRVGRYAIDSTRHPAHVISHGDKASSVV